VKGFNLILSKTGESLKTEYDATSDAQCELPEVHYKNYPNVVEEALKELYSDSYLRAAIRAYLYGEPAPKDEDKFAEAAPANTRGSRAPQKEEAPATGRATRANMDKLKEEVPDNARAAAKEEEKPAQHPAAGGGRRNILADLDNLGKD
jgi:hypothetical protein